MSQQQIPDKTYVELPLDENLRPSNNIRTEFPEESLKDLAANIKIHGVIEPIIVRPIEITLDGEVDRFNEIVAGERRYRASKLAGKTTIPAIVRHLSDAEAAELQTIENLQREDINYVDEAFGFKRLRDEFNYSTEEIGKKIGKSKQYVYAQLQLCTLSPEARKLASTGKLTKSLAVLISRIPVPKLQAKAAKEICQEDWQGQTMSQRSAVAHIKQNYTLDLKEAPFKMDDAKLDPKAGACSTCPKRSGNQADLPDDFKNPNVCTDPDCFNNKRVVWQRIRIERAKEDGQQVIEGKAAKAIFPYSYSTARGQYEELKNHCYDEPKNRSYAQLAKLTKVQPTLVINPHTGFLTEVIDATAVKKALKDMGELKKSATLEASRNHQKEEEKKVRAESAFRNQVYLQLLEAIKDRDLGEEDWKMIAYRMIYRLDNNDTTRLFSAIGWAKDLAQYGHEKELKEKVLALSSREISHLMFAAALIHNSYAAMYSSSKAELLLDAAKRYDVDADSIRARIKEEQKAKDKAKQKKVDEKAKKEAAKAAKNPTGRQTASKSTPSKSATKKVPAANDKVKSTSTSAPAMPKSSTGKAHADFMRPMQPSNELSAIVGAALISRSEATKKVWDYIKLHKLQDQNNKRMINVDHALGAVCGSHAALSMFELAKVISNNLSPEANHVTVGQAEGVKEPGDNAGVKAGAKVTSGSNRKTVSKGKAVKKILNPAAAWPFPMTETAKRILNGSEDSEG